MVDAGEDCNNLARPFSHDRALGLLWTAACVASLVELLKVEAFCLGERSDQTQTMHSVYLPVTLDVCWRHVFSVTKSCHHCNGVPVSKKATAQTYFSERRGEPVGCAYPAPGYPAFWAMVPSSG